MSVLCSSCCRIFRCAVISGKFHCRNVWWCKHADHLSAFLYLSSLIAPIGMSQLFEAQMLCFAFL
jgi:hypothetical protein